VPLVPLAAPAARAALAVRTRVAAVAARPAGKLALVAALVKVCSRSAAPSLRRVPCSLMR